MSDITLDETWQSDRALVNDRLEQYLSDLPDCPDRLREAMRYSLLAGGKRLRPVLVLMACQACGGDPQQALPAACAVEMIHTYSLVHDDLPAMDDDDLRRGRPTCHIQFGEALAILAGDGLLTLAFEILARDTSPPAVAAACCADLASAAGVEGMVGGQAEDVAALMGDAATAGQLDSIHRKKTGRLLTSAVTMGGRIAGASPDVLGQLRRYGAAVGLAFQIADDLLDLTGSRKNMGKGVQKDADHGKLTYPALYGIEASRQRARALIDEACQAVSCLGEHSRRLTGLAHFVLERNH